MTDQIRPEQTSPAVGLDVGTSRIVVAHRTGGQVAYESQLNAFVTVPHSKITQTAFERENVTHAVLGSEISVHGNESQRFATYVNAEMRRPMTKGVLDAKEPESLRVIRDILTSMLKAASPAGNADRPKQKLCFTIPAAPFGAESMCRAVPANVLITSCGVGRVTRARSPERSSTTPILRKWNSASRTAGRPTPKCFMRSRSDGSNSDGA